jgi:hypothetical protein
LPSVLAIVSISPAQVATLSTFFIFRAYRQLRSLMGSTFAALCIALSTLALLSQGYVVDESCARDFGQDIVEGVAAAMQEGWKALNLVNSHATQEREDGMDNTRSQMFKAVEPTPETSPQQQAEMRATQLGKVQGRTESKHALIVDEANPLPWQDNTRP